MMPRLSATPAAGNILNCVKHLIKSEVWPSRFSTSTARSVQFYPSAIEALHDMQDGAKVLVGGYGCCGIPHHLIDALVQKKTSGLVLVSNDGGVLGYGHWHLVKNKQVRRYICGHIGENEELERQFLCGEIEVELTPLGTIVEKLRAGAAGIPAFFTPTGHGTLIQTGGVPIKCNADGSVAINSKQKEAREFGGVNCVLEESIRGDFALVKAWKADKAGNLIFRKSARNTNPPMCKAGVITVVEVEEIVETGDLPNDDVHVPHIYVQRIVQGHDYLHQPRRISQSKQTDRIPSRIDEMRDRIVKRAALELKDGHYINLGIGLPSLIGCHIDPNIKVHVQCDNGTLGLGPPPTPHNEDPDLVDAGSFMATIVDGGSYLASDEALMIVRGGHLDLAVLGAMEVSQFGDLANWMGPGKLNGMGGAMDLVIPEKTKIIVTMKHTAKGGKPKILKECTLPLTGKACVDMLITEMGVFEVSRDEGLVMIEIADGCSVEDVREATACEIKISPNLKAMRTRDDQPIGIPVSEH